MIQVKNLSVLERLQPLSFQVEAGEVLHVVGPNGSGKSTLLAAMAGLLDFQGKLVIGRSDIKGLSLSQLASLRAYLTQFQRPVFNLGIAQYLALSIPPCASLSHSQTQAVIEELTTVLNIDDKLHRYIHQLSGGEWQRVRLCAACLQVWPSLNPDAKFLVLDEPASSLDVGQEALLFALIERAAFSGLSVVMSNHDLNRTLKHAHRALLLNKGTMHSVGNVDKVLNPASLSEIFKVGVGRHTIEDRDILTFD
tara:strand:- start:65 stop:820 length:756 start_codon:yes stop_codon:yes gene_type:complete